jgi:hypothetical protein
VHGRLPAGFVNASDEGDSFVTLAAGTAPSPSRIITLHRHLLPLPPSSPPILHFPPLLDLSCLIIFFPSSAPWARPTVCSADHRRFWPLLCIDYLPFSL